MLRTRWRKVLLDLWGHKARTLLVIAAIAVGVLAIGFIASAQAILLRELNRDYENLNAASATIYTTPFDQGLVDSVQQMPAVSVAEGRRSLGVRVAVGNGQWRGLTLNVIPDYDNIKLDRILPIQGAWPPQRQELIVEHLSIDFVDADIGDTITIELNDGTLKELTIVGTAFDNSVPSAEIINRGFGYISRDTMERLGQGGQFTELRFRTAENSDQLAHVRAVTAEVEDKVEKSGREVFSTRIPPPGEHWAEDIIATLVLLFFVFGGIILFLAGFLVINTVSALLTQQMQQIGVMKLVGAQRLQIMGMYIVMVVLYSLVALAIGIPAGIQMGRAAVGVATELLNVTVDDQTVPLTVIAVQAAVGLLIPLLAALWPVLTGVNTTTQQALSSDGMSAGSYGQGLMERVFLRLQETFNLQRPLIISLRNTLRRKGRLILTLLILVMGTALFISVLTVRDSVSLTLDNFLRYHPFDVGLVFNRAHRSEQLTRLAERIPQVETAEAWLRTGTRRQRPDDTESVPFTIVGVPPETRFLEPRPEVGRWLRPDDTNALVVNTFFLSEETDVGLGDEITLRLNGRDTVWTIVGAVPSAADGSTTIYAPYEHFTYVSRMAGQANSLQFITVRHDAAYQQAAEVAFTAYFNDNGYQVSSSSTAVGVREEFYLRFDIVILFLIVMAVLLAIVGGLGLTTTMSINILERIREIGVLRAIGASNGAVRQIVVAEGLVVGFISWAVGSVLAVPLSIILSNQVGNALLQMPLDYAFAWGGMGVWLLIVLVIAAVASLGPAQNASRLTIREVLAYE